MRFLATFILITSLFLCAEVNAQQLPLFSLYRENSFVVNPAIAGAEDHAVIMATARQQWTKVKGAPSTQSVNFRTPINRTNHGIGAQFLNDITGPTAFTGFTATYAYHLKFYKINPFRWPKWLRNSTFSFGLSASLYQYRLNASELRLDQPNDNAIATADAFQFLPGAGVGVYYYYENFFLGYSAPQLIPLSSKFEDDDGSSIIKRVNHNYVVVGGKIPFKYEKVFLEPMVWLKQVKGAPLQIDGHLRVRFKDKFWLGAAFRSSMTIVGEIGFKVAKHFQLGYAYDQQISDIANYMGGSHELILGWHFNPQRRW